MAEELNRERFIRDWFTDWNAEPPVYGWATELLMDATGDQPELAWSLILNLIDRSDEDTLTYIAAGPLEDLLCNHGGEFIDRVEAMAAADDRFKRCLAGVWGANRMEPSVYRRMCEAAPGKRGLG